MEVLDLTNANLYRLPTLSTCRAKVLQVSGNKLRMLWEDDFPRGIEEFHAESNRLIDDGLLVAWPASLKVINLADNPIRYLNYTSFWPQALRSLTLSYCHLRGTLAELPPSLEVLAVDHTHLEELSSLPASLKELHAGFTRIQRLPTTLPVGLERICLAHCELKSRYLPNCWPAALRHLDLAENFLKKFPRGLPAGLQALNLSGNRIAELGAIPDGLEFLHLGRNSIRTIPEWLQTHRVRYTIQENCLTVPPGANCLLATEQWDTPFHHLSARAIQTTWEIFRLRKTIRTVRRIGKLKEELFAAAMHPDRAGKFQDVSPEWNR